MSGQFVLFAPEPPYNPDSVWLNSLLLPAYLSLCSILIVFAQLCASTTFWHTYISQPLFGSQLDQDDDDTYQDASPHVIHSAGIAAEFREHIAYHGGYTIYTWKFLRFITSLVLLALSVAFVFIVNGDVASSAVDTVNFWVTKKKHKHPNRPRDPIELTPTEWYQISLCAVFLYTSVLSLITLLSPLKRAKIASAHVGTLLFAIFCVYTYRDLWPLCTFTLTPADAFEGGFLWARLSLITFAGVIMPSLIPTQYIPIDPKKPQTEINPEQDCSLLSFFLFTFLDPIIFKAFRQPHLPFDELPPLCDYDRTEQLVKRSFKLLDPYVQKTPRYMFWNLMRLFWREYSQLFILITVKVLAGFLAPLTIKQLLLYVEQKGVGAVVQPWVWILLMFLGPVVGSLAFQWYIFITTGTLVRVEGIITQLVFEHSLRIRMVEKTATGGSKTTTEANNTNASTSRSSTPTPESIDADGTIVSSVESDTTLQGSSSTTTSDGKKQAAATGTVAPAPPSPAPGIASAKPSDDDDDQATNLTGRINNLITVDTNNIIEARDFLFLIWYGPLELAICCWFLYSILEWSSVVGIATLIICFPLPGYCAKLVNNVQKERMKRTDARTQNVTEVMSVLRMIKLFAWEKKTQVQMNEKREDELKWIKKRQILQMINWTLNYLIPIFALLTTYSSYTLIWKKELTASRVFSSMAVFDMLRDQLHMIFYFVPQIIQGKVSLDRVDKFLRYSELLDEFKSPNQSLVNDIAQSNESRNKDEIGFQDATFSWSDEEPQSGALTPSRRSFRLRIEGDLFFKRGQINLIIGPTGCGKTSLLYALLGEMHFIPTEPRSWFNLPRAGGVAYAAQESWVQNETIKDNILFGSSFNEERYKKVIYQCGLEQDLTLFDAGDSTEVGEKGLTLSGGQKARITLARAIYSNAEILLLDDVLAALDVHTAKWIVDKCFKGDLVAGRTVILVTHNVTLASPIADYVVSLGLDGRIQSRGTMSDALRHNSKLLDKVTADEEVVEKTKEQVDTPGDKDAKAAAGKLIVAEEIALGHVRWPALKLYFVSLGGWFFWTIVFSGDFIACVIGTLQTWYLGYWASQYDNHGDVNVPKYLAGYTILLLSGCVTWFVAFIVFFLGSIRASRTIYNSLTEAILGTTLRWLDVTPTSRVIARCTQDIRAVDGPISSQLADIIDIAMFMTIRLAAVVIVTPLFLVPGLIVGGVGAYCGQIYIKAQLSVKREMSNARSPVLGHFGAAIAGLTSLRAYGAQAAFRKESMLRVDKYIRAGRTFYCLNRWISVRVDTLGSLFAAGLAAYLVYYRKEGGASTIGFSLNMAVAFSSVILWLVRIYNEFEVQGNSLERIQDYIEIEQEPRATEEGKPPAYWPASGNIRVENLSARYSTDGPLVLHNLSFDIKSGERIGVVGRTGSGKSSLTLALLRCILTTGNVYYDGINTADINLEALRSNITIIPQQPELLTGTLRQNLDPFSQHDDATLNDALRSAGLFSLQDESDEARIGLDSPIASGGSNLSVGQRQILALARAIIRQSKLLILDEATSAIDYDTDTIIQNSIRRELKDVSLITVAHRLQTIMDADRIMVLNAGKLEEYDTPKNLLQKPKGFLRALVDESGDREKLYEMAEGASTSKESSQ